MINRLVISDIFSIYPMGRDATDGPDHGQRFFNEYLLPRIEKKQPVVIVFDGTRAIGSSFLDEAFHVMPTEKSIRGKDFRKLVAIQATDTAYVFYKSMAESFMQKIPG